MTSWTAGYISDIPYSAGFYRELAPTHLDFAALAARQVADTPASYLELGSGQGLGLALLAAAEPDVRFHGMDFNPEHIVTSRRIASGAGLDNVEFEEASFEEFVVRKDAGTFDRIVLHGILSWVSPEAQAALIAILRRSLAPGGLAYVSYNTLPGWAATTPLQNLMRTLARRAPSGRSDARAEFALKELASLKAGGARYFEQNPAVAARLEKLGEHGSSYLAHEYMNGHWQPLYFAEVAAMLEDAKLTFVGSATLIDGIDAVSVPDGLQTMVGEAASDPIWQETLRDYAANRRFRRDLYARGLPAPTRIQYATALETTRFVLATSPDEVSYTFEGPLCEVDGHADVYDPLVRRLAEAEIASFGELMALPVFASRGWEVLLQSMLLLVHSGQVRVVAPGNRDRATRSSARFNRFVLSALNEGQSYGFLASPVTGSGLRASGAELLALSALLDGCADEVSVGRHVLAALARRGQRPAKDNKPIASDEEALAEILSDFRPLLASRPQVWKRLGIL